MDSGLGTRVGAESDEREGKLANQRIELVITRFSTNMKEDEKKRSHDGEGPSRNSSSKEIQVPKRAAKEYDLSFISLQDFDDSTVHSKVALVFFQWRTE